MDLIRTIKDIRNETLSAVLRLLPIKKNKIVFDSYIGQGYKGNPKYIAEEIIRQNLDYDIVWLVTEDNNEFPDGIRTVKYATLTAFIEMATAKFWVFDCRGVFHPKKKKGQVYLHTWHAPFGFKLCEKSAESTLSADYVKDAKEDGRITDAIISDSDNETNLYLSDFWLNENAEILKIGLPRNDFLVNSKNDSELRKKLRAQLNIGDNDILVMYEPTFRDDYSTEGYMLDFKSIQKAFEDLTKKKCFIGIRLHPVIISQSIDLPFSDTVLNLTKYPDVQELAIAGDYVISDYSSAVFDFVLLQKPVFICALDLNHYVETRGLNKEFYEYPFPVSQSNIELINQINEFDKTKYEKQIDKYFSMHPIYDKGDASKKAVEWIKVKTQ